MHAEEGVDVRLSTKLEGARGNGSVEELRLSGGGMLACDRSWSASGSPPTSGWLKGSRWNGRRDHRRCGRTRVPHVFAAGDVARGSIPAWASIAAASTGTRPRGRGRGGAGDARRGAGRPPRAELLERPVRTPNPVLRATRISRTRPPSRASPAIAASRSSTRGGAPRGRPRPWTTRGPSRGSARRSNGLTPENEEKEQP